MWFTLVFISTPPYRFDRSTFLEDHIVSIALSRLTDYNVTL